MKPPIILTHCGKLGDFLYSLPIASWLWKTRGQKIHWVLPWGFAPFNDLYRLLYNLPFTERLTLVAHPIYLHGHGGQPYKFNPATYGVPEGEYYNIGFRGYPDKFITAYYAEEHGFDWDRDFVLDFGEVAPTERILRTEQWELAEILPHAETWQVPMCLYELGQMLKAAKERHTWYSGPAAMMFLARMPFYLHYEPAHPPRRLFLPEEYFGGKLITPVLYKRKPKT